MTEYDQIEAVNISSLLWMDKSPRHYRQSMRLPPAQTDSTSFGTLAHMAVLEPERFATETVVWPREMGRRYGKAWDEFRAAHEGKSIVSAQEHLELIDLAGAVLSHPVAGPLLLTPGKVEHTIRWADSGIECKGRVDKVMSDGRIIIDLKTCTDASAGAFGRSAARYHYHARAAWYSDGWHAATGEMPEFFFVAVESARPYNVAVYKLGLDALLAGRDHYKRLLAQLKQCRESDVWPGIAGDQVEELQLPEWVYGAADAGLVFDSETV